MELYPIKDKIKYMAVLKIEIIFKITFKIVLHTNSLELYKQ